MVIGDKLTLDQTFDQPFDVVMLFTGKNLTKLQFYQTFDIVNLIVGKHLANIDQTFNYVSEAMILLFFIVIAGKHLTKLKQIEELR